MKDQSSALKERARVVPGPQAFETRLMAVRLRRRGRRVRTVARGVGWLVLLLCLFGLVAVQLVTSFRG